MDHRLMDQGLMTNRLMDQGPDIRHSLSRSSSAGSKVTKKQTPHSNGSHSKLEAIMGVKPLDAVDEAQNILSAVFGEEVAECFNKEVVQYTAEEDWMKTSIPRFEDDSPVIEHAVPRPVIDRVGARPVAKPQQKKRKKDTECIFWKEAKCSKGSRCPFSHDGPGREMLPIKTDIDTGNKDLVCRFMKSGSCINGNSCPYSHDLSREPCVFHHFKIDKSGCKLKNKCPFSHDPITEEQRRLLKESDRQWKQRLRENKK